MSPRRPAVLAATLLVIAAGCGREQEGPSSLASPAAALAVRPLVTPAAPGSSLPSLTATGDGRTLLGWVEPRGAGRHALRFASRARGGAWSEPLTVAEGPGWFVNWADFPHLAALADGTLFAHWLEKRAGGAGYDYDVRLTRSRDGGRHWDAPIAPYTDRTPAEHGFVSLAALDASRIGALFLDGRETKRPGGAMTLRFAAVPGRGAAEPDVRVDPRVCDCCQTALARTARGLVAAYRDRSERELRDIAVVRLEAGRWSEPVFPGAEGWEIHGCPVNGPALAAEGDRVVLAWFTMARDTPRAKVAFSGDGGATWGPPHVVDDGRPIGRVDVVLLPRAALVSWLEETDAGASVRVRRVGEDGARGPSLAVAGTKPARSSPGHSARTSGFPRLSRAGGEVVVAWRDAGEPPRVVSALVEGGE